MRSGIIRFAVISAAFWVMFSSRAFGAESVPESAETEELLSRIPVSMKRYNQYADENPDVSTGPPEVYTADFSYDPAEKTLEIVYQGSGWYFDPLYSLADFEGCPQKEVLITGLSKEEIIFAQNPVILSGLIQHIVLSYERCTINWDFNVIDHKLISYHQEVFESDAADPLLYSCRYLYDTEGHLLETDLVHIGDWDYEAWESFTYDSSLYFQYDGDRLIDARFPIDHEQDPLDGPGDMIYDEDGRLIKTEDMSKAPKWYETKSFIYTDWGGLERYKLIFQYGFDLTEEKWFQYDDQHRMILAGINNGTDYSTIIEYQYR